MKHSVSFCSNSRNSAIITAIRAIETNTAVHVPYSDEEPAAKGSIHAAKSRSKSTPESAVVVVAGVRPPNVGASNNSFRSNAESEGILGVDAGSVSQASQRTMDEHGSTNITLRKYVYAHSGMTTSARTRGTPPASSACSSAASHSCMLSTCGGFHAL